MARWINLVALVMAAGSAVALYGLKHDTRRIEALVQARERAAERAERDISVLKAERAYLGRPERIEELARAQGLEPVRERQYVRIDGALDDGIARMLDKVLDQTEDELQAFESARVRALDSARGQLFDSARVRPEVEVATEAPQPNALPKAGAEPH